MDPQIRYARTSDDVGIAFWVHGSGPTLVQTPLMPGSHIEMEWQNPYVRRWYERLGEFATVVRYDGRGSGLSSRHVQDFSLESQVRDLQALLDRLGSEPVALLGAWHSGPAAITYAARHPDRVSHLIPWCTYASGADFWESTRPQSLRALRHTEYRLFLRTMSHELLGWEDDPGADSFAELLRHAVEPEMAEGFLEATRDTDVRAVLGDIQCPTLVMSRRDLQWGNIDLSRDLASRISDASLVLVEGQSPLLGAAGDIEEVASAISGFLGVESHPERRVQPAGPFRVVLFTDLVSHTQLVAALGDEGARLVLREHERITREVLAEHEGTEVKALGDGFMASFPGMTRAIQCAVELQRRIEKRNEAEPRTPTLMVRIGINAGEPIEEDGDLFGATVILASRIAAAASGGEILVANSVRDLSAGKGFNFEDRGNIVAKGFDEPVHIWSVEWRVPITD
jgi:class 3 adenylate cyclase